MSMSALNLDLLIPASVYIVYYIDPLPRNSFIHSLSLSLSLSFSLSLSLSLIPSTSLTPFLPLFLTQYRPVMIGDMSTSGNFTALLLHQFGKSWKLKFNAQVHIRD